jgi:hypothetical protein
MRIHVTALPSYGGIRLPLAMGAVVEGVPSTRQTPLSGQVSPVRALVPIGERFAIANVIVVFLKFGSRIYLVLLHDSDIIDSAARKIRPCQGLLGSLLSALEPGR